MSDLFDFPQVKIEKPIRLIELFSGIGSQSMALRDIGANFEAWKVVEFDKYAIKSYNAIHGTDFEPTDIRNIHGKDLEVTDKDKYDYILTYSFPCQDLSQAGLMKGMKEGSNTHSSLLWEVKRLLNECHELSQGDSRYCMPNILLMENVPAVHSEQNRADFDSWLSFLRSRGYHNFWRDLNARDYGIPQNRERCFCVSVLADEFTEYEFPKPIPLEKVMKDYLETEVDDKYYINNEKARKLIEQLLKDGVIGDAVVGGLQEHQHPRTDGISPSLTAAMGMGGGQTPMIAEQTTDCAERLICVSSDQEKSRSQTASRQGTTAESQTCKRTEAAYLNYRRIDKTDVKVAKTLCARDYKGFGTGFDTMNGVIEWRR